MVGGQVADMIGEEKNLSLEELAIHSLAQNGKIITCSVLSGAILGDAMKSK